MRDKIITAGLTFVVIWMLARACIEIPRASVVPTPSVESIYQSQVITADNITSLVELTQLSAAGSGPVAAMTFTPDMQVLLAAYAHEGVLRHWRIQDGVLLKSFDTYPVELGATAFDGTGSLLATSAGWAWELHKPDVDYIGARVWDTQTGLLILRHIQENISQGRLYGISIMIDVVLSPDGKWLLASDASADDEVTYFKHLFQMEVATGRLGTALFDFSRQPEEDDFDVIAFDSVGEYFAAAGESGEVDVFLFNPPEYPAQPRATIEQPGPLGERPLALAFDPRRHWLARIRGNEVVVWDLQSSRYNRQFVGKTGETVGPTASLAFNSAGTLLGVGTANGWQIWDVQKQVLLAQGVDSEVYSILFSPDGRLFAWGDSEGVVNIWGIPDN